MDTGVWLTAEAGDAFLSALGPLCSMPDPYPTHPESSHRWSQAAPGPFRAWGARGSRVSRDAHLTQLSLVALGTLQWRRDRLSAGPSRGEGRVGAAGQGHGGPKQEAGESYLGSHAALLALLPWFSFRTLKGKGGQERER